MWDIKNSPSPNDLEEYHMMDRGPKYFQVKWISGLLSPILHATVQILDRTTEIFKIEELKQEFEIYPSPFQG